MKIIDIFKTALKINTTVIRDEVEEIKNLIPTEEDATQGKAVAVLAQSALAAMGIPTGVIAQKVLAKVFTYAIRDIKDGAKDPNKLIIGRVIDEVKAEKEILKQAQNERMLDILNG